MSAASPPLWKRPGRIFFRAWATYEIVSYGLLCLAFIGAGVLTLLMGPDRARPIGWLFIGGGGLFTLLLLSEAFGWFEGPEMPLFHHDDDEAFTERARYPRMP